MNRELPPSRFFPPIETSRHGGLLLVGGELSTEWLLDAYRRGIFPWPTNSRHLAWWSPEPRAVIEFERFHVSRRLQRTWRSGKFALTSDRDFAEVIRRCGTASGRRGQTWITPELRRAYCTLHELGHAHSVEAWQDDQLVGGVYGVAVGGLFAAESMFHTVRDASKVALAALVHHLRRRGYRLLDIQQLTPHTASLGACEIPRAQFLVCLAEARDLPVTFGGELEPWPRDN